MPVSRRIRHVTVIDQTEEGMRSSVGAEVNWPVTRVNGSLTQTVYRIGR